MLNIHILQLSFLQRWLQIISYQKLPSWDAGPCLQRPGGLFMQTSHHCFKLKKLKMQACISPRGQLPWLLSSSQASQAPRPSTPELSLKLWFRSTDLALLLLWICQLGYLSVLGLDVLTCKMGLKWCPRDVFVTIFFLHSAHILPYDRHSLSICWLTEIMNEQIVELMQPILLLNTL